MADPASILRVTPLKSPLALEQERLQADMDRMKVQETRRAVLEDAQVRDALARSNGDLDSAIAVLWRTAPYKAADLTKLRIQQQQEQRLQQTQDLASQRELRTQAHGEVANLLALPEDQREPAYQEIRQRYGTANLPPRFDPSFAKALAMSVLPPEQRAKALGLVPQTISNETELRMAASDPNHPMYAAAVNALKLQQTPNPRPAPEVGSFGDYLSRRFGPNPTDAQILQARKDYSQSDDRPVTPKPEDEPLTLSDAGMTAAAINYAKTGQLPPMGNGKNGAALRAAIINKAAEMFPDLDVAGNKAGYTSDQQALSQLTKQRESIGAFEQTAQKNIDTFLTIAGKVTDTGIPLLNTPVRWAANAGGSADVAAYNAARQVAVSEIAKIVQNPGLTGQLSDSARHEIEVFNPANATLKQTVAVLKLLKQDMANRTTALDAQLAGIRERMKRKPGEAPPPSTETPAPTSGSAPTYRDYLQKRQQQGGR